MTVHVQPAPYLRVREPRVCLRFDEDHVRECGCVGEVWLTRDAARKLAEHLLEALRQEAAHRTLVSGL
jgi:hypothetical protein